MGNASFEKQTAIYFRKVVRIAFKEKFWKFIVFAFIISFLVATVVGKDLFKTYEDTQSGFFTIASAGIWIGIFNSIQSICKEHAIIRAEYRSGMKLSSYITANALWQLIICIIQSLILMSVCTIFADFDGKGIILSFAWIEYLITIFLVTYGADIMGMMISSIAGNATTAMTIMPFVLILQLIMSGVLFDLSGWSRKISNITFSKWGMSALGSIADMNNKVLFIVKENSELEGMIPKPDANCYKHISDNLIKAWVYCAVICFICYIISIISLKIKNRDS